LFLQSWWSRSYNRPLKDPLLQSYSLEELLYEFYDRIERAEAEKERVEQETDKIEMDKEQAAIDWAEAEEKRDIEAMKADAAKQKDKPTLNPTQDPDNVRWMEEQIQKAKIVEGETFGEDIIDEDFES
jgi:hypothetical protein